MEKEVVSLFRLCFKSLSFKRHYSSLIRNGVIAAVGLVLLGVGLSIQLSWLYIAGAVILGVFGLWALVEFSMLLALAFRAGRKGKILTARAVNFVQSKAKRNTYQLVLSVELEDGSSVQTLSEGPLWEVDVRVMINKNLQVIYLGEKRTAIVLPIK